VFGSKEYYEKEKEKILIRNNLKKIIEKIKGYSVEKLDRNLDTEEYKKIYKEYINRKKKRAIERRKKLEEYRAKKEKESENNRKYRNSEEGKASIQRSRIKRYEKLKKAINTLTDKEWMNILKEYKFRCAYCNKRFNKHSRPTKDHIIPISKGGNNTRENVIPACVSCNSKKGAKDFYKISIKKL